MTSDDELSVDGEILRRALVLMRDKYHLATAANTFLETRTGVSGISISITNQRDAITHLISLLRIPASDRDAQLEQLSNLKEHLRRACMEPYEAAVNETMVTLNKVLEQYKARVLTMQDLATEIPSAPTLDEVMVAIAAIGRRRTAARLAKTENDWTPKWDQGLKEFIVVFDDLEALKTKLESCLARAEQLRTSSVAASALRAAERATSTALDAASVAQANARTARRRAWLLCVLGALLGLTLKILWDLVGHGWTDLR